MSRWEYIKTKHIEFIKYYYGPTQYNFHVAVSKFNLDKLLEYGAIDSFQYFEGMDLLKRTGII